MGRQGECDLFEELQESKLYVCGAKDEKWVPGRSEAVELGRGHPRKRLDLYTRLVRPYAIINETPEEI